MAGHVSEGDIPPEARRVPFRVRIGITGHRRLGDSAALSEAVRSRLECVRGWFPETAATPVAFTAVTALAEGADRLVATSVMETFDDAQIEAILPLAPPDYREDFRDPGSVTEFDSLLESATTVVQMPAAAERPAAYELAGQTVVDSSDLVIAIWDHQPAQGRGGTAEIVAYAAQQDVPVLLIHADAPAPLTESLPRPPELDDLATAFARVDAFNAVSFDRPAVRRLADGARRDFEATTVRSPLHWLCANVAQWGLAPLVRADHLALSFQSRYHRLGTALFGASALAVTAVAAQVVFEPEHPIWSLAEIALMLAILGAFLIGRRTAVHERWLAYRSLAEVLRAAPFVALTGIDGEADGSADATASTLVATRPDWTQRTFSELWRGRPAVAPEPGDARELARILSEGWIAGQVAYHRKLIARADRGQRLMTQAVVGLFSITLLVATLHVADIGHEEPWPDLFAFSAIMLPGFGAALVGIRDQRQYRLHSERSRRTAERLERVRRALATAEDLKVIQRLALEAQAIMIQENTDWSSVIEFQELEITL